VRQIDRLGAVPRAGPASRAGDARDGLAGRSYASAVGIAVCDDEHLLGLGPDRAAARRPRGCRARGADGAGRDGRDEVDEELAVSELARRGGRSVAVVDGKGRFRGLVPPERALAVL
jgi:magnesium transporter